MEELEELWLELLEVELPALQLAMPWKTLCLVKRNFSFNIIEMRSIQEARERAKARVERVVRASSEAKARARARARVKAREGRAGRC